MAGLRILYFAGGILDSEEVFSGEDIVDAARHASGQHPRLTAEIWNSERKLAIVRPCAMSHFRAGQHA